MTKHDITEKWLWMMEWCRENNLAPANQSYWELAEKAYLEKNNG